MPRALVLHGGAGAWRESEVLEQAKRAIADCASRAWSVLLASNSALEAVVEAVRCMEDSGYFNAGAGSAPDLLGDRTLDAGLMTSTGLLGAVAAVRATKNPILLARLVAERTPHVLLAGEGADQLARLLGLPPLPPAPPHVYSRYSRALKRLISGGLDPRYYGRILEAVKTTPLWRALSEAAGDTVGAVALDEAGVLAAATSTGGVILKLPGRVGDTPIPGAGFYAGRRVACSATGYGEFIIRSMPCLRLEQLASAGVPLEEAAERVIAEATEAFGRDVMGFVAVDAGGRAVAKYNTEAMLTAFAGPGGVRVTERP